MDKEKPLKGKVALITGASRGIGLAIAGSLADLGAKIGLCSRDPKRLDGVGREFERGGVSVASVPADISPTRRDCPARYQKVEQSARANRNPRQQRWDRNFCPSSGSYRDAVGCCAGYQFESGISVVESRGPGNDLSPQRPHYHCFSAGKTLLREVPFTAPRRDLGLTQCMAEDLRPHNIRVSAVCPGSVATDFSPHAGKDTSKLLQPQDVAHAVEMIVTQAPQSFISEIPCAQL